MLNVYSCTRWTKQIFIIYNYLQYEKWTESKTTFLAQVQRCLARNAVQNVFVHNIKVAVRACAEIRLQISPTQNDSTNLTIASYSQTTYSHLPNSIHLSHHLLSFLIGIMYRGSYVIKTFCNKYGRTFPRKSNSENLSNFFTTYFGFWKDNIALQKHLRSPKNKLTILKVAFNHNVLQVIPFLSLETKIGSGKYWKTEENLFCYRAFLRASENTRTRHFRRSKNFTPEFIRSSGEFKEKQLVKNPLFMARGRLFLKDTRKKWLISHSRVSDNVFW